MKNNIWVKNGKFTKTAVILMMLLPMLTVVICLCLGRMNVPAGDVFAALGEALSSGEGTSGNYSIVVNLRLPRILMAIIVGAGLTCAGFADTRFLLFAAVVFSVAIFTCPPYRSPTDCRRSFSLPYACPYALSSSFSS